MNQSNLEISHFNHSKIESIRTESINYGNTKQSNPHRQNCLFKDALMKNLSLLFLILVALSTAHAAKTEVPITTGASGVEAFLISDQRNSPRRSDIENLTDNNETTWSYSTRGQSGIIIAFDLDGSHTINQFRFYKGSRDIGGTSRFPDHPNLEILVTTDTGALNTRSYSRVTGMINGDQGNELFVAARVNSDGTIIDDTGDLGWYTVTFDPATVTAVAMSVDRPVPPNHDNKCFYPMYEVKAYYDTAVLPTKAYRPSPLDGATDVLITSGLDWTPGLGVTSQTVSFGTDPNALTVATTGDGSLEFVTNAEIETALGGPMVRSAMYYWRVDSDSVDGDLWDFTTAPPAWDEAANARIEQLRKRDVTIQVVDSQGNPIDNVSVSVNQKKNHFPFGSAINQTLKTDPVYAKFFVDNFNWAVFEDQVEWYWNENGRRVEEYSDADYMAQFCRDRDIKMRGHAVFWANPRYTPSWAKDLSDTDFRTAVEQRLESVVTRYKNDFIQWDVNNEDMHFDYFRGRLGDSITKWMFDEIHKIDPDCVLLSNEYNIISEYSEVNEYKTHIQNQLDAGVAIGAIGVQGHFDGLVDPNVVYGHYENLSSLNLPIWVTEFDCPNEDENDRADNLEKFYRISFSHAKVDGIVMWGYMEGQHWRDNCHLLDSDYRVNAAGLRYQQIRNEWKTNTSGTTTNGNYSFRGFHGEYDITLLTNSGSSVTQTIYLDPGVGTAKYVLALVSPDGN